MKRQPPLPQDLHADLCIMALIPMSSFYCETVQQMSEQFLSAEFSSFVHSMWDFAYKYPPMSPRDSNCPVLFCSPVLLFDFLAPPLEP